MTTTFTRDRSNPADIRRRNLFVQENYQRVSGGLPILGLSSPNGAAFTTARQRIASCTGGTHGQPLDLHHFEAASPEAAMRHAEQLYGHAPDRGYEVCIIYEAVPRGQNSN
jgi:hypothetical protein